MTPDGFVFSQGFAVVAWDDLSEADGTPGLAFVVFATANDETMVCDLVRVTFGGGVGSATAAVAIYADRCLYGVRRRGYSIGVS